MLRSWIFGLCLLVLMLGGTTWGYRAVESEHFDFALPAATPLVLGTSVSTPSAQRTIATVSAVVDGDTVTLTTGQKVRYIGMDTPEIHHPTKGKQCFGDEAKRRNSQLVAGQTVWLEKDVSETDRYGRLLRYVWLGDTLINEQLVREGFAHAASFPPDIHRQKVLQEAERQARQEQLGLWQNCPIPETTE